MSLPLIDCQASASPSSGQAALDVLFTDNTVVYDEIHDTGFPSDTFQDIGGAGDTIHDR